MLIKHLCLHCFLAFFSLVLTPEVINDRNSNNQNVSPNSFHSKYNQRKLNLTLLGTCRNFHKGPWRSLDHTLEINNQAQASPKVQHYWVHGDFLVCVTSPWRGFDSLKCFPQSENSTTQLDIALHHKVNALSLDSYKACGLLCKILWLRDSAQILTVCIFFVAAPWGSSAAGQKHRYFLLWLWVMFLFSSSFNV